VYNVVYAGDVKQMRGLQASVQSLVDNFDANKRAQLTVHILVQEGSELSKLLCLGAEDRWGGALVRVRTFNPSAMGADRSVSKINKMERKERGDLDVLENYARFYLDTILPEVEFALYLDVDTIVAKDASFLIDELRKQKDKTFGFVKRPQDKPVLMSSFLDAAKACYPATFEPTLEDAKKKPAWNVGIYVVNLRRFASMKYRELVNTWISRHNNCKVWKGGSQPPLLLAVHGKKTKDYLELPHIWNFGELGWRLGIQGKQIKNMGILHWNGPKKPWTKDGLYTAEWTPYYRRFHGAAPTACRDPEAAALKAAAEPGSMVCAKYVKQLSETPCEGSYDCVDDHTVRVTRGCRASFALSSGKTFICESWDKRDVKCDTRLIRDTSACSTVLLTTFIIGKEDWQRKKHQSAEFKYMSKFYNAVRSFSESALKAVVLHDGLPENFTSKYTTSDSQITFEKIDLSKYDRMLGVNDVRYHFFREQLEAHSDWDTVFITDVSDVVIRVNPCTVVSQQGRDKVYAGIELDSLKPHPWMLRRYESMGEVSEVVPAERQAG
jgi:lipopolysaccharide biosynthesis glycosyltransferase